MDKMEKEQEFNFGEEQQQEEGTVAKKSFFKTAVEKYSSLPKYAQILIPIVIVVVILFLLYFLIFSSPAFSLKILVDGKQFGDASSVSLFSNDGKIEFTLEEDLFIFEAEDGITITVKVKLPEETITKQIVTNKKDLVLNITTSKETDSFVEEQTENIFSIFFTSKNGVLNKSGKVKLECEDYSQELPVANGKLENIKIPCKIISVIGNLEGIPPVSQSCNPGICKLLFEDAVSSDVKLQQNLITSKLIVYVNYKDGTSAKEISVEIREDSIGNELVDLGKTKDFGSFSLDLAEGKYIVLISDPSGKYASQQKSVSVPSDPVYFVLDVPAIGNINVNWDLEDNNVLSGNAIMKDENNTFLETKSFDTNSVLSFPIKEKGTYKLSFSLVSQFSDYVTEDSIVIYDKNSGDLNITSKIRKVNPFTDQNVVVQVIDAMSKKPIPFAKIWFENNKLEFLDSPGFVKTDANGVFSKVFPAGTYVVKLKHDYLSGVQSFNVEETKSLTMTSKFVTLPVACGNADIEVCLKDLTGDAFIEVYSLAKGLQSTFFIEKDKSCAQTSVKSLETVYAHVVKDGYFEQYSQAVFLKNNETKKLEIELTPVKPNAPQTELESSFVGIYTTSLMTDEAKELKPLNDYFYAFKLKLPQNTNKKIKFIGVAGDLKDENAINSKMQIWLLNSVGTSIYFEHFSPTKETVEENEQTIVLDDEFIYKAKSFTSVYNLDKTPESETEIIYAVRVSITNNVDLSKFGGDTLLFSYWFGYEDEKYDLKKLNKVVKKIGTQICEKAICIDAYLDKMPINGPAEASQKGNIFAKLSLSNKAETNISIYNSPESGDVKKKSDLTVLNIALDGKVTENTVSGVPKTNNLNFGPIYLEGTKIQQGSYLDFDVNFEMLTPDASSIEFRIFDNNWESANGTDNIKLVPMPTKNLKVEGMPEFIVPYVSNKINLNVLDEDSVPVVDAEIKYYSYESANWKYKKTANTNEGGTASFETEPVGLGDKIKIVVSADGYKLVAEERTADFNFLKTAQQLKATVIYPDDTEQVFKEVEIENISDYDLNIYNLKYYWDADINPDFLSMLLKSAAMEEYFANGSLLKGKEKLDLMISYNKGFLASQIENVSLEGSVYFNYIPIGANTNTVLNNLDTKLQKSQLFTLDLRFKGAPDNDNCLLFDFKKDNKELDLLNPIVFLDSHEENLILTVQNSCMQNRVSFDFTNVYLNLQNNAGLIVTVLQGDNVLFSGTEALDSKVSLKDSAKGNSDKSYQVKITIPDNVNFNDLANSLDSASLSFGLSGEYYSEGVKQESSDDKTLNLAFKTLETCVYFGLDEDSAVDSDIYKLEDTDILRLPYYLAGERNNTQGNVVVEDDGSDGDVQSTYVINGIYETNILPLKVENKCNKDLVIKITENTAVSYTTDSQLTINFEKTIVNGAKKTISIMRPTDFSGAVVLSLFVKKNDEFVLLKKQKINIESSVENPYFVKNPFVNSNQNYDSVIYKNEYFPEYVDEEALLRFEDFGSEIDSSSVLFWDGLGSANYVWNGDIGVCSGSRAGNADKRVDDFLDFGFNLVVDKEKQTQNDSGDDDDEIEGFRYAIYEGSMLNYGPADLFSAECRSLNYPGNFEFATTDISQKELYKFAEFLGPKIKENLEFPYFINIGTGLLEGDSGDNVVVHGSTYCPTDFEPVRIYLDSYENDLDCFGNNFEIKDNADKKITEYYYGGKVCLDEDGVNDEAYGRHNILTICRLKSGFFKDSIERPIVTYGNIETFEEVPEPKFVSDDFGESCFGGGVTGKEVTPKLSFGNENVNCEVGNNLCSMPEFSKYVISLAKGSNEDSIKFNAGLLYDNYSEDVYSLLAKSTFLANSDVNLRFLSPSGKTLKILQTGSYSVNVKKKDSQNIDVYLVYKSYLLPDHLFYYLPFVDSPTISEIGTFVDSPLFYSATNSYPLVDESIVPLFSYHVTEDLPLNLTGLPTVLAGTVNLTENGGGGEINFSKNNLYRSLITFKDGNYFQQINGKITYLKTFAKIGEKYYPGELYFDINVIQNVTGKEVIIKEKYQDSSITAYLVTVTDYSNLENSFKKINKLDNLSSVADKIKDSEVCYLYKDNGYVYYWNLFKIMNDLADSN